VERVGKKKMKGVLLFAFNNGETDYVEMACYTAKRVNRFLNLPVSIVTDYNTDLSKYNYTFDKVIIAGVDDSNVRNNTVWLNKGRYNSLEFTPYDETIVMDTDYLVNSNRLLSTFDLCEDFMCHKNMAFILQPKIEQEKIGMHSIDSVWATTMTFKNTNHTKQIFDCMRMVQENYEHYSLIHSVSIPYFRNDYALAIALRLVNGHIDYNRYFTPWKLLHVGPGSTVYREADTEYVVTYDNWNNTKLRKEYIAVKDTDFHMIVKSNFMEMINE
jgi:hypothetical protein